MSLKSPNMANFTNMSLNFSELKHKYWLLKTSVSLKSPISLLSAILSDFRHIEVLRHANFCFKWWFQSHWGFKTSTFLLEISNFWWIQTHWVKTSTFLLEIRHFRQIQTHWGFKTSTYLLEISHFWWFQTHWGWLRF